MTVKKASAKPTATKPRLVAAEPKKAAVPLIIESHPKDYTGFPFITLIQYRKQPMLAIIDNADEEIIRAFVLDLCGPEHVDEEMVIHAAADWYANNKGNYPLSIEFSRRGMTSITSKIYRALNIEFVSRVIGPVPKYPLTTVKSIKRRRRKPIPSGVEIHGTNVVSLEQLFK